MKDPAIDPLPSAIPLRLVTEGPAEHGPESSADALVGSYRRLADVFHEVLSEQSLEDLLERIADTLADLVPYEALHIYEADEAKRELAPMLARSEWEAEIMGERFPFGEGITGWAVEHREPVLANQAHLDPRVRFVPGTPIDPESLICVPLLARGALKGTLNIYRIGEEARFSEVEFELATRFGDAAALALDNAHIRERLEHQAQTDSLTGLLNHRAFHERLRVALTEASAAHETVGVVMLDIDDFKKVNDVHGHAAGDEILAELADQLRAAVRVDDLVCRVGGEEFALVLPATDERSTLALAERLCRRLETHEFPFAGRVCLSVGVALGPRHAMNPRELVACAEAAMMTAKARGKDRVVLFDETATERPEARDGRDDVRSIAHLKLLQSLGGTLNRLNDVRAIGAAVARELRAIVDYHNCRVFLREGDDLVPIAFHGELTADTGNELEVLAGHVGEGITGRAVELGESVLVRDAANCDFATTIPGTAEIEESLLAVPINHGSRAIGAIVVSKLGLDGFDADDQRLLEVLAGHAASALENARLYEAQRRDAEGARALLEFARGLAAAEGLDEVLARVAAGAAGILGAPHASVWLQRPGGDLECRSADGPDEALLEAARGRVLPAESVALLGETDEPLVVSREDYAHLLAEHEYAGPEGLFAVAPFTVDERRGAIAVAGPAGGRFGEREIELLGGLAQQAKLAIANASTFESLQRAFVSGLEVLAARPPLPADEARRRLREAASAGLDERVVAAFLRALES